MGMRMRFHIDYCLKKFPGTTCPWRCHIFWGNHRLERLEAPDLKTVLDALENWRKENEEKIGRFEEVQNLPEGFQW